MTFLYAVISDLQYCNYQAARTTHYTISLNLLPLYSRIKQQAQPELFEDPAHVNSSVSSLQGKNITHPLAHWLANYAFLNFLKQFTGQTACAWEKSVSTASTYTKCSSPSYLLFLLEGSTHRKVIEIILLHMTEFCIWIQYQTALYFHKMLYSLKNSLVPCVSEQCCTTSIQVYSLLFWLLKTLKHFKHF